MLVINLILKIYIRYLNKVDGLVNSIVFMWVFGFDNVLRLYKILLLGEEYREIFSVIFVGFCEI